MADISEMIEFLWRPPRINTGPIIKHLVNDRKAPENFGYYRNWGFTVYRTFYGPDSDKHWDTLIDAVTRQTLLALGYHENDRIFNEDIKRNWGKYSDKSGYLEDINRLKKLFRLTTRENPLLFDGLDIPQIQEVCRRELPRARENIEGARHCFVLVADERVLKDVANGVFVITAVDYDQVEERFCPEWVRMSTGDILNLWESLFLEDSIFRTIHCAMGCELSKRDLETYVWSGLDCIESLGDCSEAQTATPGRKPEYTRFRIDY